MNDARSRLTAWQVVDQMWSDQREASESNMIKAIPSERVRTLFDLFWQEQFEDDRRGIRQKASEFVDLLISDGEHNSAS